MIDGVCTASINAILREMKKRSLSADNIAFGMGGELLQKVNCDTQKFAMKASAICINQEWKDIYKDPVTDQGKRSKKGRLALIKAEDGTYETIKKDLHNDKPNELRLVFRNGQLLIDESLEMIRQRADISIFCRCV